ncbi:hypothetical protein ACKVWM_010797 [Pyricularia oryzae]
MSFSNETERQLPDLRWMKAKKGEEVPWDPTSDRPFHPKMHFSAGVVSHPTAWPRQSEDGGDASSKHRWTGVLPMPRPAARGTILEKYAAWRYYAENPAEVPSALEGRGRAAVRGGAHSKRSRPLDYVERALAALNRELATCCVCQKSKMTCAHHDLSDLERAYRNMKGTRELRDIVEKTSRNFKNVSGNNARSAARRRRAAAQSASPNLVQDPAPASHQVSAQAALPSVFPPPVSAPLPPFAPFAPAALPDPEHISPGTSFGSLPSDPAAQGTPPDFDLLSGLLLPPALAEDSYATASHTWSHPVSAPVGYRGADPTFIPDSAPGYFPLPLFGFDAASFPASFPASAPVYDPGSFPASAPDFPWDALPDDLQIPNLDFNSAVPAPSSSGPFTFAPMVEGPANGFRATGGFDMTTSVDNLYNSALSQR